MLICKNQVKYNLFKNLYNGFKRLPVNPVEIRLTGGLSRSEAWCQTIADIFGAETVPVEGEGAALGAALHAAWVWLKEEKGSADLKKISAPYIKFNESMRKKANPVYTEIYKKQSMLFSKLVRDVKANGDMNVFSIHTQMIQ